MRIALIAEGCYPYVTGGVSTWCDQLVRGLSEHEFEVVAITASSRVRPALALPDNVTSVRAVPLWDWGQRLGRVPRQAQRQFLETYTDLLRTMLDGDAPQRDFDAALVDVFEFAQAHDIASAMRRDEVVAALIALWPNVFPAVNLSVRDALEATELLEHMLLPLAAPIPQVDLCHIVSNGLPALPALAAKWRYGTPIVMSEHGVYLRERYLAFQTVQYGWAVKTVMLAFLRRLCRTAYQESAIVAPVNVFNRRWEVRHGADPDRIRTVYNGVDAATFAPAGDEPDRPTVGWVGRVDPLKDLDTLVRAFAVTREQVPDAVLRLFGPTPKGNEEYEASIRAVVTELGLDDAVTFEGPIRPVSAAYAASTVVALSSISEGLPYTVMEAMMCARATVSTDVGGVSEVTGSAGVVVPPRDPKAFGDALAKVLSDDAARADLGRRARERALEMFQLETMLGAFREVYTDVLDEAAAAVPAVAVEASASRPARLLAGPARAWLPLPRPSRTLSPASSR